MRRTIFLLFLITVLSFSGCGILLIDVPIQVPIKGQGEFIRRKYRTREDMYIIKYKNEIGYYMHSTSVQTDNLDSITFIPKGSIFKGSHITRLNGWPNGTFYHYVARLENWSIFHNDFVVQTTMDSNRYKPLDQKLFESIK